MRSLLDVNVLISLLDADHTVHRMASEWFAGHAGAGWASCPLTENGCVRIMSHPGYPNARSVSEVAARLRAATGHSTHQFWPDGLSLLDEKVIDTSRIHGPRQLTDAYLLALAVKNGGRLVTFDSAIPVTAVLGAKPKHLVAI